MRVLRAKMASRMPAVIEQKGAYTEYVVENWKTDYATKNLNNSAR